MFDSVEKLEALRIASQLKVMSDAIVLGIVEGMITGKPNIKKKEQEASTMMQASILLRKATRIKHV